MFRNKSLLSNSSRCTTVNLQCPAASFARWAWNRWVRWAQGFICQMGRVTTKPSSSAYISVYIYIYRTYSYRMEVLPQSRLRYYSPSSSPDLRRMLRPRNRVRIRQKRWSERDHAVDCMGSKTLRYALEGGQGLALWYSALKRSSPGISHLVVLQPVTYGKSNDIDCQAVNFRYESSSTRV